MAAITAKAVTGNFSVGTNWVGDVAPTTGDTVVIPSGATITVDADSTVGTDGATGTTAVTVQAGGQFIVPTGVTLTCRGDLVQQRNSTVTVSGTLLIDPPSGATYYWVGSDTGSSDYCNFVVSGGSVIGGTRGGVSVVGKTSPLYQNFILSSARFENLGTSSVDGIVLYAWRNVITVGIYIRGMIAKNCGKIYLGPGNTHPRLDADGIDIRSAKGSSVLSIVVSNAKYATAIRTVKNLTVFDSSPRIIEIYAPDITYSDWVLYNTVISTGISAAVRNNASRIMELATVSYTLFSGISLSGSTYEDFVYFARASNQHYVETSNAGSLGQTVFSGFLFDGDNYVPGDAGDCFIPKGAVTIDKSLHINKSGTIVTALDVACRATIRHATSHNSFHAAIGETAGDDEQLVSLQSCLFSSQDAGVMQDAAVVAQSVATISHNAYHDMTNATNLTHPTLADRSYMGPQTYGNWYTSGTFDGSTGRGNGDVSADPQFVDSTRTVRKWFGERLGVDTSDAATWTMAALAAEAVKLNGVDSSGDASTPIADLTPANCLSWVREGFAPTNPALKDAGHDGVTIGALEWTTTDETAPVISSLSAVATGTTTATITFSTDEANGSSFVLLDDSPTATEAAILAGLSQSVTTTGEQTIDVTALDHNATYYAHVLHKDAANNVSNIMHSSAFKTADLSITLDLPDTAPCSLLGFQVWNKLTVTDEEIAALWSE